jgi:pimeloyl-ACP methyl ester carboxylesterase
MTKHFLRAMVATSLTLGAPTAPAAAQLAEPADAKNRAEIGYVGIGSDIILRRSIARPDAPKGVVLLLHGFPETFYAWQDVSTALAADYEVHAFDWPGFGLSTRPSPDTFAYAPRDYARILRAYIDSAGIDRSKLTIYATDIGALPALLAALEDPEIARAIVVGDFAPFDRPQHMQERLQALKSSATNAAVRAQFNAGRDEILANAMRRGLAPDEQFEVSSALKADMAQGWTHGPISTADAFAAYYANFTRDQDYFEANIARLETPVRVVWGAKDVYIDQAMGAEFAARLNARLTLLPGVGHYPHLQNPERTVAEIRATFSNKEQ